MLKKEVSLEYSAVIDPMGRSDIGPVMAIERRVFSSPWTEQMFLSELKEHPFSYVVRMKKQIVGYIIFRIACEEMSLMNLAVDAPWQKCGLGEALIRHALHFAKKQTVRRAMLEVRASNAAAQRLYKKLGFLQTGCRRNYYSDPVENALLFEYGIDCLV